nr:stress response protein NST1-like [Lolium perenne]
MDMDYVPKTCEDISFVGIAVGGERCRVHNLEPNRCVAFEGMNTGRRFYMCSVGHILYNCGFVAWVDEEWPATLQNALRKLWAMYHEANNTIIEERIKNAKLVQELVEDRNKFKNYNTLMDDVDKFTKEAEKRVMEKKLKNMNEEMNQISDLATPELEAEVIKLNSEMFNLKEEKKRWEKEREELKTEKKQWEKERDKLKEENKKTECMLFDLLKVCNANKEKLMKIKQIVGQL